MKLQQQNKMQPQLAAFTLVEMLVVIAIIAILASILIPVVGRARTKAKVAVARAEMAGLEMAIKSYKNDYNRWPKPRGVLNPPLNYYGDLSYGWVHETQSKTTQIDNSGVMRILMAEATGSNANHVGNPKKTKYFEPKDSNDPEMEKQPGLSATRRYCDIFGNEYKFSMDFNGDGLCFDAFYSRPEVSGSADIGLTSLVAQVELKRITNPQDLARCISHKGGVEYMVPKDVMVEYKLKAKYHALKGEVMIWSFGPDKDYSKGKGALEEFNEDNILNWR